MASFYNENENRSYPFITIDPLRSELEAANQLIIPDAIIVDFGCMVGLGSGYEADSHQIYLRTVERIGDRFYFEFRCTAPGLENYALTFYRDLDAAGYPAQFAEADMIETSGMLVSDCEDPVPIWEGFIVFGDAAALDEWIPTDAVVAAEGTTLEIEPGLVQNIDRTYVRSINLANTARTVVTPAEACSASVAAGPELFIAATCLAGDVRIKEGYNCSIRQDDAAKTLTISAGKGAGAGEPCEEVPLGDGDGPQPGSRLYTGGPQCNEVIRTVNGLSGPILSIKGGSGVTVRDGDNPHQIKIIIDLHDLTACLPFTSASF